MITRKIGMTSVIADDGVTRAVTLLAASPNVVTQVKTAEVDGYEAVQLGFEEAKLGKAQAGHFKRSNSTPKIAREFRIDESETDFKVGEQFSADLFSVGDIVHATGISKGKGFAGVIKRHNFRRGPKTHGGRSYRRPGSIGSMYPQKIFKGKRMAGRHGHARTTVKNLTVALVDPALNVIGVAGAVPGPRKGIVLIRQAKS